METINLLYDALFVRPQSKKNREDVEPRTLLQLIGHFDDISGNINFYPSDVKSGCYETAYFVSISKQPVPGLLNPDQLVGVDDMLKIMMQNVLIECVHIQKEIVFIIDDIASAKFEKWRKHFEFMQQQLGVNLKIYYFSIKGPKDVTKILI